MRQSITTTPAPPPNDGEAAVYRLFGEEGELLYIGSTSDLTRRWIDHKRERVWWSRVVSYTLEWHANRSAAYVAEGVAVKLEAPLHNILGTPAGSALARSSHSSWVERRRAIGVFSDYADHPDGAVVAFARAREDYEASLSAGQS